MLTSKKMTSAICGTLEAWYREAVVRQADDSTIIMQTPKTGQAFEITVKEVGLTRHENEHDSEFAAGCRFCDWEREHNAVYTEGKN